MHRGYGVRFSYTGHDFHGLVAGPDGRIYFSTGDRGASIQTKEGHRIEVPDEGAVFRCEPDGSRLELVMRGLRNPQELAFDDYGNLFTGDNDSDQGDRERWVAVTPGADAGWRIGWQHHPLGKEFNPWLAQAMWEPRDTKKTQPAYILSPIANLPDGPSGLVHYPGTGLPAEFAGNFFLAGYKGSTAKSNVSTFKSVPDGAGFKLTGLKTFIDNIQATDVDFGPDSRLYVSAWDEGWERTDQGRIYRLSHEAARREQSAQIAEVQKILAEGFTQRSSDELAKLLGHFDQRVRLGAQWALAEKGDARITFKRVLAEGSGGTRNNLTRIHAIWGLAQNVRQQLLKSPGLSQLPNYATETTSLLQSLDRDQDAEVRAQAIKALAELTADAAALTRGLQDASPRVRYYAALALAKHPNGGEPTAIAQFLRENDGKDAYLQHAGVMALARVLEQRPAEMEGAIREQKRQAVLALSKDASPAVRLATLLACRAAGRGEVASFLTDSDPAIVREAAIAINDAGADREAASVASGKPETPFAQAQKILAELNVTTSKDRPLVLRVLNANFRHGDAQSAQRLAKYAAEGSDDALRGVALEMLAKWGNLPARDYVVGIYRPLPRREADIAAQALTAEAGHLLTLKSEKLVVAAAEAIAATGAKQAGPQLFALVQDTKAATKSRVAGFTALAKLDAPELKAALTTASTDAEPALQTEANKLLGKTDPNTAAKKLAATFDKAAIAEKKQILDALGDNPSPEAGKAIAALLAKISKVPGEVQLELLEAAAKHNEAKPALAAYQSSIPSADPLAKHLPALAGGDPIAGEKLFNEHAVAACLRCHKVDEKGGEAGPALDGIASRKDRRFLLESIVNVNASVAEGFQMVIVTKHNGETLAGLLKKETAAELILENPGTPAITIKKADVKQRDNAPSGMLPNIADLITPRELRDIVEYLASLK